MTLTKMDLTFKRNDEIIIVRIVGNNILFANETTFYKDFYPIDLLSLDYQGIIKEFPDLKDMQPSDARIEAICRFKKHIKKLENEISIRDYITKEFEGMNYELIGIKRQGFREVRLK